MQQINLYPAEFRPKQGPLRTVHMAWALLAIFILLMIATAVTQYQYQKLTQEFEKADQLQQSLQAQLLKLAETKAALAGSDLDIKIEKLQKDLQHRQELISLIASQNLGNAKGFSAQMLALANASLDTISLEAFSLQKSGSYAELAGKTRLADQIPLYVQKLRADPSFANVGFGVLNIEREENSTGVLDFSLAKAVDEKEKANKPGQKRIYDALFN